MGSPFKMIPGEHSGSNKDKGLKAFGQRGLIKTDLGPKDQDKVNYDTNPGGRPTVYGATEAIPANIKQRVGSTSSSDDTWSGKSFKKDPRSGDNYATQAYDNLYSNKTSTTSEFKRGTGDKSLMQNFGTTKASTKNESPQISSDASTMDPRSGKSLVDSGAFGTESQVANYGYGDLLSKSYTNAATIGKNYNSNDVKIARDSKIVDANIKTQIKKYKTGEKAINLSSGVVDFKGPDINSQLLGGMKVGDGPKPPPPKKPSNIHIVSRTKAGKIIGDIFGKKKNRSGQTVVRSAGNTTMF
jgi:hypothetical protein